MTEKRTTFSTWVYRVTLALMVAGSIKYTQFMYHQMSHIFETSDERAYLLGIATFVSTPLGLFAATLAMFLRSGAVIWLVGLLLTGFVVQMSAYMPLIQNTGFIALLMIFLLMCLVITFALFRYLIQREEIRTP
ncbi:MAG: hypothetical protein ABJ327_26425 [Litoreibacter sp.]